MTGPLWARWIFGLLSLGSAVCSAVRLWLDRRGAGTRLTADERAATSAHLLMGAGMGVMFLPVATPIPSLWWAVFFGVHSAWLVPRFAAAGPGSLLRSGRAHLGAHVVAGVVMAAMFAALPAGGLSGSGESHAGHLAASSPVFAVAGWLALAYFLGQAAVCGVGVAVPRHEPEPACPRRRDSALAACVGVLTAARVDLPVRLFMGLGMSYMLLTML
jgi:hypothetical protein